MATVLLRNRDTQREEVYAWDDVHVERLASASPWRTFRFHRGQRHFSGSYWSSTEQAHVIYESRLELSWLRLYDWDRSVQRIVAQPFLLRIHQNGRVHRHVPDYLLLTCDDVMVVDVKPRALLSHDKVITTLSWMCEVVEERGWRYEVRSEPPHVQSENMRFLAGFRHENRFNPTLLDELRAQDLHGRSFREACSSLPHSPTPLTRSALLHLVWSQHLTVDMTAPLTPASILADRATG